MNQYSFYIVLVFWNILLSNFSSRLCFSYENSSGYVGPSHTICHCNVLQDYGLAAVSLIFDSG